MRFYVISGFLVCAGLLLAQAPSSVNQMPADFVPSQFGSTCSREGAPPPLTADLDGDGVEDLIMIARCKNPMIDEAEHNFSVIDPYNAFYGYGNPKVTSQFASEEPDSKGRVVLIVEGLGADAWRAAEPKAKFVIINLPFKQISVKKLAIKKKKVVTAIVAEETGGNNQNSAVYWDGKKYRYQPMGASME